MTKRINAGIPKIQDYTATIESDLFLKMEAFSNNFLDSNKTALVKYSRKWVADPLHQCNRQWEYPFAFSKISEHASRIQGEATRILDAGSGVTFFPYFVASNIADSVVTCCDYDSSLESIFSKINRQSEKQVEFSVEDIHKLSYEDGTFDIVYCISVLEHTRDFEVIIKEFKRVLKRGGMLIVTFDVSIDGRSDMHPRLAEKLLKKLYDSFPRLDNVHSQPLMEGLRSPDILSTRYIREFDPGLLPWSHPFLSSVKSLLKFRMPKGVITNVTCFGEAFEKE